ncbi:MAG: Gfo/Idh/MocA family oxidoreductase [Planctomycetales bacterium]|nr:Gfo/Idh/MocA family oxidoreductase [Planctomycetales bacterium]
MKRVRMAVVGTGHLGKIHARLAAGLPEIELTAVVDANRAAAEAVAQETGARPVAQLVDLVGEVDAAVVATPTDTHFAVASQLIDSGIHVLAEKPLAPTVDEADRLVRLARRAHCVLQVGHVERFNPALEAVRDQLIDPKYIEARRQSTYTFRSTDVGVVLDLMIHDIDIVLSLVQSAVTSVDALGVSVMGGHEDMVSARLHFECGAVASLTASRTSYAPARHMQVFTPHRFASIDFATRQATIVNPHDIIRQRRLNANELAAHAQAAMREQLFENWLVKNTVEAPATNAIENELRDFAAAILTGSEPRVTGAAGRDAVFVAEMVLASVAAHRWDGRNGQRIGPLAQPQSPAAAPDDFGNDDDTVIWRKAG